MTAQAVLWPLTSFTRLAKSVKIEKPILSEDEERDKMTALYNLYFSIFDFNNKVRYHVTDDVFSVIKEKFAESEFGTIVVASTAGDVELIKKLNLEKYIVSQPMSNSQNAVVVSPNQIYDIESVKGYKNIIFLHKYFDNEHLYFSQKYDVYEPLLKSPFGVNLSKERDVFARVYKHVCNFSALKANDVLDLAEKLAIKDSSLSAIQILFSMIVFMELNFIEFDEVLNTMQICKAKKMELNTSKFYNSVE